MIKSCVQWTWTLQECQATKLKTKNILKCLRLFLLSVFLQNISLLKARLNHSWSTVVLNSPDFFECSIIPKSQKSSNQIFGSKARLAPPRISSSGNPGTIYSMDSNKKGRNLLILGLQSYHQSSLVLSLQSCHQNFKSSTIFTAQ